MSDLFDESLAIGTLQETFKRYTSPNPFAPGDLVKPAPGCDVVINGVRAGMMIVLEKIPKTQDDRHNVRVAGLSKTDSGVSVREGWLEHWQLVKW